MGNNVCSGLVNPQETSNLVSLEENFMSKLNNIVFGILKLIPNLQHTYFFVHVDSLTKYSSFVFFHHLDPLLFAPTGLFIFSFLSLFFVLPYLNVRAIWQL